MSTASITTPNNGTAPAPLQRGSKLQQPMHRTHLLRSLGFAAALAALSPGTAARASLIWNGSASLGTSVFKNLNIQDSGGTYVGNPSPNGSHVTVVNDPTYGSIWDFYKDDNDRRCEAHGASGVTPAVGDQFYIGW